VNAIAQTEEVQAKKKKAAPSISEYEIYEADTVIPFAVKKKGVTKWYCIGHMSGANRDKYFSTIQKSAASLNPDGTPNMQTASFDGMSVMLLQYCVYGYTKEDAANAGAIDDVLVGREVIETWGAPFLDKLANTASALNAMTDESADAVGNDS
jgi:hypothetical protein